MKREAVITNYEIRPVPDKNTTKSMFGAGQTMGQ